MFMLESEKQSVLILWLQIKAPHQDSFWFLVIFAQLEDD